MIQVPRTLSISALSGVAVANTAGEELGKTEDYVIDLEGGHVVFAIISAGGFMGRGNRLFAVPWDALKFYPHERKFTINVDRETFRKAPSFEKSNWPDMTDRQWASEIYNYYGYRPYWKEEDQY